MNDATDNGATTFDASKHYICVYYQRDYGANAGVERYFGSFNAAYKFAEQLSPRLYVWISERGSTEKYDDVWIVFWWNNSVDSKEAHEQRNSYGVGYIAEEDETASREDRGSYVEYEPLDPTWRSRHRADERKYFAVPIKAQRQQLITSP